MHIVIIIIIIIIISFFKFDFYITFYNYKKPINVNQIVSEFFNSTVIRTNTILKICKCGVYLNKFVFLGDLATVEKNYSSRYIK